MKNSIVLSVQSFGLVAPAAQLAEKAGVDRVWLTETPGRDALLRAFHVARETATIGVGTGIAYAFTRHPMAMASAAIEVSEASGGRVTFAIGAGPDPIRRAVGVEFDHPAPRLAEYLAFVRGATEARQGFTFDGRFYTAALPGFSNPYVGEPIQIYGSGLNRIAITAVARVAHGISLHPLAVFEPHLENVVLPAVEAAGKKPKLASWCVASIDPDHATALRNTRTRLAVYLSNPSFRPVLDGSRWTDVSAAVQSRSQADGWVAAGELIPEDLIDELTITGTPDEAADRLKVLRRRLGGKGVDELALQVARMSGSDEEMLEEIERLALALTQTN